MAYRDDELTQFRSRLTEVEDRLKKFEALYKEKGIKKKSSFFRKATVKVGSFIKWFVTNVVMTFGFVMFALIALALIAVVSVTEYKDRQARDLERAHQQELLQQCDQFCDSYGYEFHGDRREDTCYCGSENSNEITFIVNVSTAEHWAVTTESE